jgi:pimeloyl-ACP methyl ester carboxylesterase
MSPTPPEGWIGLPWGTRVFVTRQGKGDPIVLLHGIAHSSDAWSRVIPALAQRYEVVALDLPGCGRSDKPETDYSLGAQAAAVRYALDSLGLDLVTVVGHSFGGGIAMMLALQYPERVGRLAVVSSAGFGRDLHSLFRVATLPVLPEYAMRVLFHPAMRRPRNLAGRLISRATNTPFFVQPDAYHKEFEELLVGLEDPAAQRAFTATLRSASHLGGQAISALDRIGSARFPILIVWGREDRVFPVEHALRAAKEVPDARLVILDGCGHFPQIEATQKFTRVLLKWLKDTQPARTYNPRRAIAPAVSPPGSPAA